MWWGVVLYVQDHQCGCGDLAGGFGGAPPEGHRCVRHAVAERLRPLDFGSAVGGSAYYYLRLFGRVVRNRQCWLRRSVVVNNEPVSLLHGVIRAGRLRAVSDGAPV
jgi:hypothetical protein